jgi:hypothetical protein
VVGSGPAALLPGLVEPAERVAVEAVAAAAGAVDAGDLLAGLDVRAGYADLDGAAAAAGPDGAFKAEEVGHRLNPRYRRTY